MIKANYNEMIAFYKDKISENKSRVKYWKDQLRHYKKKNQPTFLSKVVLGETVLLAPNGSLYAVCDDVTQYRYNRFNKPYIMVRHISKKTRKLSDKIIKFSKFENSKISPHNVAYYIGDNNDV